MAAASSPPEAQPAADAELVAALQRGESSAFERMVRTFGGRMLAVARRLLSSEEDAQDAVQDAFLSAFRSIERFDNRSLLSSWLHRITVNAALSRLRQRRRQSERLINDLLPRFRDDGHQAEPASHWRETGETACQRQETRDLVRQCIAQLPEGYREVLLLRDIEELDTEETARLMGLNVNAVKTRLHRARQALRTLLDPYMRGES